MCCAPASLLPGVWVIAAASANSDFCLPGDRPDDSYTVMSPDTTVYRFLDRKGYAQDDLVRQISGYYVAQCQNVEDYIPDLVRTM